jgi:hypothetical protein
MQNSSQQKSKNTKTIADINTLSNTLATYKQEKNTLPNPQGNINYF